MLSVNDFKRGVVIKIENDLFSVVEFLHVKPGKGGAFVRTKLKSLTKGTVIDRTFRGGEKVEDVKVERRQMQYLYDEGDSLVFMDTETYDQQSIDKDFVGDIMQYIREGDAIEVAIYNDEPISAEAPNFVKLKVTYAEPGVRGDTATNVTKPVTVETGAKINVPLFVNEGDVIKIDTRKGEYVERVKQ
ncbi:MAG: elongation factor P [Spirochaetes bacterium]|jgi:elongation factor P|nr:elongation factor P [Spirochaetota bacterium]